MILGNEVMSLKSTGSAREGEPHVELLLLKVEDRSRRYFMSYI